MKLLIYSHDTYGLGNIRRILTIAAHLSEANETLSILLVSGSPMLHAFRIPAQVDYVKLPCLSRTQTGEYVSPYLNLSFEALIQLRSNLILSTVLDYQPDVLMIDKKPLGLGGELAPALETLDRRVNRPHKILLLRDILDSPAVTHAIWKKNHYFDVLESSYDTIMVVGEQSIFDVAAEYGFPAAVAAKTRYCGYLERLPGRRSRVNIRRELGIGDQPLVLVTVGGGADGCHLLSTYLQGIQDHEGDTDFHTLLVTGSEMSATKYRAFEEQVADCPAIHLREFTDDMMSYMNAADVVLSMGGYNTVCELLTLKKRAIIVPRTSPVMEQCIRAEKLADRGLVQIIHPDRLTPALLIDTVTNTLQQSDTPLRYPLNMHGLDYIRQYFLSLPAANTGEDRNLHTPAVSDEPPLHPFRDIAL